MFSVKKTFILLLLTTISFSLSASNYRDPFKAQHKKIDEYNKKIEKFIDKLDPKYQEKVKEDPDNVDYTRVLYSWIDKENASILKKYISIIEEVSPEINDAISKLELAKNMLKMSKHNRFAKEQKDKAQKKLDELLKDFHDRVVAFEPIPEVLLTDKRYTKKYPWLKMVP